MTHFMLVVILTSCIKFLIDEKTWSGTKGSINTKGFVNDKMSLKELIEHIEDKDLEEELFELCQETYDNIMEKLRPKRKRKY